MRKVYLCAVASMLAIAGCTKSASDNTQNNSEASGAVNSSAPAPAGIKTADGVATKKMQSAEIGPALDQAPDHIKPSKTFVVDGDQSFDGWYLAADTIEFKPGSRLIFSQQAVQGRRNLFIIAKNIVDDDAQKPGTITFVSPATSPAAPTAGQAATGNHAGGGGGAAGGAGADGLTGNTGPVGFDAPNLTIVTMDVPGSGPRVEFKGGQGGQGGQGQQGGDGGNGAVGVPASENAFNCRHGGGTGGQGGAGGSGGQGGPGGVGGAGGTVTIMAPDDKLSSMLQKMRILTSGGPAGQGGLAGKGGNGGRGGQGGAQSLPYCRGNGSTGADGAVGVTGKAGDVGKTGLDGDIFVGAITEQDFDRIYQD